jgi:hypothetical protein
MSNGKRGFTLLDAVLERLAQRLSGLLGKQQDTETLDGL